MLKRTVAIMLMVSIVLSLTSLSFAQSELSKEVTTILRYGKVFTLVPNAADPVAVQDNVLTKNGGRAANIVVTASDVGLYKVWGAHDWEYCADGYVTAAQYHYARAEIWNNGSLLLAANPSWGTGRVNSCTPPTMAYGLTSMSARIFYGS